jgi:hypothetical protein
VIPKETIPKLTKDQIKIIEEDIIKDVEKIDFYLDKMKTLSQHSQIEDAKTQMNFTKSMLEFKKRMLKSQ